MSDKHKHKKEEAVVDQTTDKVAELESQLKRCLADYQNLERRTEEDRRKFVEFANEDLIKKLLVVVSDLDKASEHINDAGLNKVNENFKKILESFGLVELKIELGKTTFDPNLHEAIESIDGEDGVIMKLYRKGYILNSKVIQTAIVAVGQSKKE